MFSQKTNHNTGHYLRQRFKFLILRKLLKLAVKKCSTKCCIKTFEDFKIMIWEDECYLLSKKKFRENANIINIFTKEKGKVDGIVYGGNSRK